MQLTSKTPAARIALVAAFLVAALILVPAGLAGKGTGKTGGATGGGSSLGLVMVTDVHGDGLPNYGDSVTFSVSTSASWPSVELDCYQNGVGVSRQIVGFYPSWMWSRTFVLSSYYWTGGAADCIATLYYPNKNGSTTTLATLGFHVNA